LSAVIGDVYREEKYEYPIPALREAIINAVTHRNYLLKRQNIKVAIFDNRIEVTSSGDLPVGFSVDDIGKTDFSKLRNLLIGRIFSELKIIEQWGRGFSNIIKSCKQYENIVPEFMEELMQFKIIFWNRKIDEIVSNKVSEEMGGRGGQKRWAGELAENTQKILTVDEYSQLVRRKFGESSGNSSEKILYLISKNKLFSAKKIAEIICISPRMVEKYISEFKKKGLIKRIGPAKGGYWEIISDVR